MRRLSVLGSIVLGSVTMPASAEPAVASMILTTRVASFCQIDAEERMVSADGQIGLVRNTCNITGSYAVRASFTNLAGGQVDAGNERASVDGMGRASIVSNGPRRQNRLWTLRDARKRNQNAPVIVRFSIMPF